MRTGANLQETSLTPTNVNSKTFGKLLSYGVDGDIYAQPLYMSGLNIADGAHNVVFVATEHNSVYALDADSNAGNSKGVLWQVNLGPSAATPTNDFGTRYGTGTAEIVPEIGITGTPVIDPGSGTLFVDALTHENGAYYHRLHALDITTGAERPHSPVVVAATVLGTGAGSTNGLLRFDATQHLQRSALALANGVVYLTFAGHSDTDPFHGWMLGYNTANLQPVPKFIFNSTPNSTAQDFGPNAGEGGIWMGGSGPAVDSGGNLYLATGNGSFNATATNGTEYGCTVLKFSTGTGLSVADYFTPHDQKSFNDNDLDLGAVILLPDQPGPFPHLLAGVSKSGAAWLLNRDQFTTDNGHYNSTGGVDLIAQRLSLSGGVMTAPAYFNGTIYYSPVKAALGAYVLSNGSLPNAPTAQSSRVFPYPGVTPCVSANGNRNGIVWALAAGNSAILAAYDAANITTELYNSTSAGQRDALGAGIKFAVPTIANGKVYVGGRSILSVFGLLSQTSTNSNTNVITGNYTNAIAGSYNGLFFPADGAQLFTSGSFTLTVSKRGIYTGRLQIGPSRYPFKGQLASARSGTNTVKRMGASPLSLTFLAGADDGSRLLGTVSARNWTADLSAELSMFNTRSSPAYLAGKYTAIFPVTASGDSELETPYGNSFATITVSRVGAVFCTLALADGTKLSQGSQISELGHWPFYASMYRARGQLIGWLSPASSSQNALSGDMNWTKSGTPAGLYSDGFDCVVSALGSSYQPPSRGMPVLDISNGYVSFNDGLNDSVTNAVTLMTNNKLVGSFSPNQVVLKLAPSTGLFRGTFDNPTGGRQIPFSGVVLQNENAGSGYYLLGTQSGRVDLGAQ